MRLGDVLSKPPKLDYTQVDGFLIGKKGLIGQQVELSIGSVMLNYYCTRCDHIRTFTSKGKLYCVVVGSCIISIDCVLACSCNSNFPAWFLVECDDDILGTAPNVRILKYSEKLSDLVSPKDKHYGEFSLWLGRAECAYRNDLGAGSIVYLRKVFEQIVTQTAKSKDISLETTKGKRKNFREVLKEVDEQCAIIPSEFSANGYRLFGDLSNIIHGDYDEKMALDKFKLFYRLVTGILENIKNHNELQATIGDLGWENVTGDDKIE